MSAKSRSRVSAFQPREPELYFSKVEVDRDTFTQKTYGGEVLATYTHITYDENLSLLPSKKNITEIFLGDLVEITLDGKTHSGVVYLLSTYIGVRCLGDEKLFRIDDCQFIKRIV